MVVGIVALGAVSRRDLLLLGLVATVPLSLNLEQLEIGGVGLYLPTEPILFGLLAAVSPGPAAAANRHGYWTWNGTPFRGGCR